MADAPVPGGGTRRRSRSASRGPGRIAWQVGVVCVALLALLVPLPPALIERYYSSGVFPLVQQALTRTSNAVPFALFDVVLVVSVAALVLLCARDLRARGSWLRRLLRVGVRVTTTAAIVYVAFLAAWGLNYRRVPLREKVPFSASRISSEAAVALARETVAQLNRLHAPAHEAGWVGPRTMDPHLVRAFHSASRATGSRGMVPARPKQTVLDPYFRRAGVAGMTDPFFLETLVTSTLLPFERPFVIAHEWGHLAGYSDEGEANFVAWLTCLRGGPSHQYSGWLFLYAEVMNSLPRRELDPIARNLTAGPRADLEAMRRRLEREISRPVSTAGWQIYDRYLRVNQVDAGTASYAEVVRLVIGTDLR